MPRRTRKTPWSRAGCGTCKRRRKKCDGNSPKCNNCERLGLDCEQFDCFAPINVCKPSRRKNSNLARYEDKSKAKTPTCKLIVCTGQSESERSADVFVEATHQAQLEFPRQCWVHPTISPFSSLPSGASSLLDYYFSKLSVVLVNANSQVNPLRALIVPRLGSSDLLLDAICAVAAVHRSESSEENREEYATIATKYYLRVLGAVRELLPQITTSYEGDDLPDTTTTELGILASIFLCKYEIMRGGIENWRHHLLGIESMLQSLQTDQIACMPDTVSFVRSFLTYHKNIARITECAAPASDDRTFDFITNHGQSLMIDPYMGLSHNLIALLRRAMGLSDRDFDARTGTWLKDEINIILASLDEETLAADHFIIPKGMTVTTLRHIQHVAEAYKNVVLIAIHAAIDTIAERRPATGLDLHWQSLRDLLPSTKGDALADCLQAISLVPMGCPEEAGLLPLLFLIICETTRADQTCEALQRVEGVVNSTGLGNVRYTGALLKQVSKRKAALDGWHDWRGLLAKARWDLIIS